MAERLILVVDDEEPRRRVLAGFLKKEGYGVETAGDADEAMKAVSSRTVDLVLTDLRMPGQTGVDLDELEVLVARTLERRALVSENRGLREQVESRYRLAGLETGNARMQEAINVAARAAGSGATILIRGESGTVKELLARAIHYASPRRRAPLVAVNVAALPETLLESELFGHDRGAFTGAGHERRGRSGGVKTRAAASLGMTERHLRYKLKKYGL